MDKDPSRIQQGRRTFLKGAGSLAAFAVTANTALAQQGNMNRDQGESHSAEKPKPIITGISQAEGIAQFACRTSYDDLDPARREHLKASVLDSLGCALSALGAPAIVAERSSATRQTTLEGFSPPANTPGGRERNS